MNHTGPITAEELRQIGGGSSTTSQNKTPKATDIQELMEKFGPPGYHNAKGQLCRLNEPFWAALRAKETDTLYEPAEGRFYCYDSRDGVYHVLTEKKLCTELAARIFEASHSWGETWYPLQRFRASAQISGVIAHLKGQVEERGAFKRRSRYIHCANTVLHFRDDSAIEERAFSPDDRSRNASPLKYDPAATCPRFVSMLLGHLHGDDVEVLQKLAGQALLNHNLTQKVAILDGPGRSSKGAFVGVIRKIVGERNCAELRTKMLDQRFEAARVAGRSLLFGADVNDNFLNEVGASRIKAYTGGDLLDLEFKGTNEVDTVEGHFNIFITCNSQLRVRLQGDESAWRRRLIIIRYERPFDGKRIDGVDEMLVREEGSGILNWCIQGAQKLFEDINQTDGNGEFSLSDRQKKLVNDLLSQSDSLRIFLKQEVSQTNNGCDLSSEELFQAYSRFTQGNGWDALPLSVFERRLPDLMGLFFGSLKSTVRRDGRQVRGYKSVKMRDANDEFEAEP